MAYGNQLAGGQRSICEPVKKYCIIETSQKRPELMMFVRAYMRASTTRQDATRARSALEAFAGERGLTIASFYVENESGASLQRPELFRLLDDSHPGDILLIEQVDRLSRLTADDWEKLKGLIAEKRVRVVALDLPTSWQATDRGQKTGSVPASELTQRVLDALNAMLLDMLAAIARKDYEDRKRRTAEGIAKAKAQGRFKGRPEDTKRNTLILSLLDAGHSWTQVMEMAGCSRSTISRLTKARAEAAEST